MKNLEQLAQDDGGFPYKADETSGRAGERSGALLVGKPITIVVKNSCLDIRHVLDEMAERDSTLIPDVANAYVASDFNCDTQHLRRGKAYSVYAIQFYRVLW